MGTRIKEYVPCLFDLWCEVSPGHLEMEPHIIRKYPEDYNKEDELKNIPNFTFPCNLDKSYVQHYSFVLTCVDSKYRFGFCRYDPKANKALVLMSYLPWHDIFFKFLDCIANLVNSPRQSDLVSFLKACKIPPPLPGQTLKISYNAGRSVFTCQIPDKRLLSIPENCNLTEFFSALDAKCMIALWAALLNERRIAIIASKPSRLSACVQAANAMLFPMSWQHVYIPILPKDLVDYLLAPMPFLIGVPRSVFERVKISDLGEIVIIDADINKLRSPFNDSETLPSGVFLNLKKALSDKNALGDAVSRAFLRALVALIGGYRDAMCVNNEQKIKFNPEVFVKTRKQNMQPFLRKMLHSQIFYQFVEDRVDRLNSGIGFNDEFEIECNYFEERNGTSSSQTLKQQYKDWAKNVKKGGGVFFKNVKDKVRQGGKNVRAKVKGLKIKMPKMGSYPSSVTTTDDSRCSQDSETAEGYESSESSQTNEPGQETTCFISDNDFMLNACSSTQIMEANLPSKSLHVPPRLPARPQTLSRYPIVSTARLINLSEAPTPPPRSVPPTPENFTRTIIRSRSETPNFQTSALRISTRHDTNELQLTLSNQRGVNYNGNIGQQSAAQIRRPPQNGTTIRESNDSDVDLIELDVSSPTLEDFDPLKFRDKKDEIEKKNTTTDSALLHEYGLDFSQFRLDNFRSNLSCDQDVSFN